LWEHKQGGVVTELVYGTTAKAQIFSGALTGNVTGNVVGNLTGNVTGNLTGNVTGNLTGNVTGDVTGNLTGNVSGTSLQYSGGLFGSTTFSPQAYGDVNTVKPISIVNGNGVEVAYDDTSGNRYSLGTTSGTTLQYTNGTIGTTTLSSYIHGGATIQGSREWGTTVSNPDTLTVTGANIDSTVSVFVKIRYRSADDTLGGRQVYATWGMVEGGSSDVIYVYQTSSAALRRIKYDYLIVR